MVEVRFHPEAQAEYQSAYLWYVGQSEQAAEKFEVEFDQAVRLIAATPRLYPLYDANHRLVMLRRYPYYLVYRIQADGVEVVAVAHSKRRAGYWQGRN